MWPWKKKPEEKPKKKEEPTIMIYAEDDLLTRAKNIVKIIFHAFAS